MQVFIVGSPLETAMALDKRRRKKQWIEIEQILGALRGNKAWSNHPAVLQYRGYEMWLIYYRMVIEFLNMDMEVHADMASGMANKYRPDWHTQEYYDQMKRRLYAKDPEHYKQWEHLGKSDCNWYFVDGEWRKYVNGKRIE